MFWIICFVMTLVVALFIAKPLLQAADQDLERPDVAFYRAQLAEVDRDVARDVLGAPEAEVAKAEISRRLLAASKLDRSAGEAPSGPSRIVAIAIGILLLGLGGLTF